MCTEGQKCGEGESALHAYFTDMEDPNGTTVSGKGEEIQNQKREQSSKIVERLAKAAKDGVLDQVFVVAVGRDGDAITAVSFASKDLPQLQKSLHESLVHLDKMRDDADEVKSKRGGLGEVLEALRELHEMGKTIRDEAKAEKANAD